MTPLDQKLREIWTHGAETSNLKKKKPFRLRGLDSFFSNSGFANKNLLPKKNFRFFWNFSGFLAFWEQPLSPKNPLRFHLTPRNILKIYKEPIWCSKHISSILFWMMSLPLEKSLFHSNLIFLNSNLIFLKITLSGISFSESIRLRLFDY